jgi:hypothetical protein
MAGFDRGKQRVFFLLAAVGISMILLNLFLISGADIPSTVKNFPLPIPGKEKSGQNTPPDPNASHLSAVLTCVLTLYLASKAAVMAP